jgi:alpha-ketoglutarate-dependent taurine dioxygenase
MMVAEDVITMVEIRVDLAEEIRVQEEKETLLQDVKADLEATETPLQEKVVSEVTEVRLQEEAKEEKVVFLKEPLDVLKALAIRQDQEDQEEINLYC